MSKLDHPAFSIIERIEKDLRTLEVDEIVELLVSAKGGMTIHAPLIKAGEFLYRGRLVNNDFNKDRRINVSDLTYPPAATAKLGRVNREKSPMFYCSTAREVVFL